MEIVLTSAHRGASIQASVGDVIVVRLPENPTTGYRWKSDPSSGLALTGDDYTIMSTAPGAGGERILRFDVRAPGAFSLRLILVREWEASRAPLDRFEVTVSAS